MENEKVIRPDTANNKEKFEYEMTDVLLQLKGAFAEPSRSELHVGSSAKRPSVSVTTPEIHPEPPASLTSAPALPNVSGKTAEVTVNAAPELKAAVQPDAAALHQETAVKLEAAPPVAAASVKVPDVCIPDKASLEATPSVPAQDTQKLKNALGNVRIPGISCEKPPVCRIFSAPSFEVTRTESVPAVKPVLPDTPVLPDFGKALQEILQAAE